LFLVVRPLELARWQSGVWRLAVLLVWLLLGLREPVLRLRVRFPKSHRRRKPPLGRVQENRLRDQIQVLQLVQLEAGLGMVAVLAAADLKDQIRLHRKVHQIAEGHAVHRLAPQPPLRPAVLRQALPVELMLLPQLNQGAVPLAEVPGRCLLQHQVVPHPAVLREAALHPKTSIASLKRVPLLARAIALAAPKLSTLTLLPMPHANFCPPTKTRGHSAHQSVRRTNSYASFLQTKTDRQ
jgi:hypothetical protein